MSTPNNAWNVFEVNRRKKRKNPHMNINNPADINRANDRGYGNKKRSEKG